MTFFKRRFLALSVLVTMALVMGCVEKQESRGGGSVDKSKEGGKGKAGKGKGGKGQARQGKSGKDGALDRLARMEFNKAAVRLNAGVFWRADAENKKTVDPGEVVSLLFYPPHDPWVKDGKLTKGFRELYEAAVRGGKDAGTGAGAKKLDVKEKRRRELVRKDLDQGRPTLVYNDLKKLSANEKKFVRILHEVGKIIDSLYAKQKGIDGLAAKIPKDDKASQSLFRRNWGPKCRGPKTEGKEGCSAIPGGWKEVVDVYPAAWQKKEGFCEALKKEKDADKLLAPFVVVRQKDGKLQAVPYTVAYKPHMETVAKKLEQAAALLEVPKEKALVAYLKAAAKAFRDNNWKPADEAWAAMNATNSKWYLRVGPDEVYWDPCNRKAGFHMTLALINKDSLAWQKKLTKVQQKMEDTLAKLIGKPYKARKVTFQMPDFIDIVINAGDDRKPFGATIGQSLPNWGPVANEGRGRTVTMTNLYTDPDSLRIGRLKAQSVLSAASMKDFPKEGGLDLLGIMLHEATHNLGPSHEYKVKGKKDTDVFGGPLATVMEELKAQTGALYYVGFLMKNGIIDKKKAHDSYVDSFMWALGHISRGMYNTAKKPKPYSQLAAIHVGYFMDKGAITFDAKAKAANGKDKGAFTLHLDKFPAVAVELMKVAGQIKARGDVAKAKELIKKYVDSDKVPQKLIKERMLRYPKASFVYAYDL